jgi:SAM-dependent methyltransferase
MLGRIFIALSNIPGLKKKLWRAWYEYLARSQRASGWTFMNYGYADHDGSKLQLAEADEASRHWIQLYDHVAGPIDLAGRHVLEVGSGRGGGSSFLTRYRRPARMVGMDLSKNAVEFSRATHRLNGLEFKVGDAEALPFDTNAFDAVINVESSHCYPSFPQFVSEVQRVLKPGGHFLYADFRQAQEVDAWRDILQKSGLAVVRETDITANVLTALDRDNDRKLALIDELIPGFLRRSFLDFAAVRGSSVFEAFRSGRLVYRSFILRKTATATMSYILCYLTVIVDRTIL